jgi:hypothetical protein
MDSFRMGGWVGEGTCLFHYYITPAMVFPAVPDMPAGRFPFRRGQSRRFWSGTCEAEFGVPVWTPIFFRI